MDNLLLSTLLVAIIYFAIKYLQKSLNQKALGLIKQLMFFLLMLLLSYQLFIFITYKN